MSHVLFYSFKQNFIKIFYTYVLYILYYTFDIDHDASEYISIRFKHRGANCARNNATLEYISIYNIIYISYI